MQYINLAKKINVSRFCFGCEALGGFDWGTNVSIGEIEKSIKLATEYGVNFFDTADIYGLGLSESRISKILAEKRHNFVIATKGGFTWSRDKNNKRASTYLNFSPQYIRYAVEKSLKRLKVDRISIYYLHWPPKDQKDIRPVMEEICKLQNEHKINIIGCSNFSSDQLKKAIEFAPVRLLQIPVNILRNNISQNVINICKIYNIDIVAYNVLSSGLLTGKYNSNSVFSDDDRRSRLPHFTTEGLIKSLNKIDDLKEKAKKEKQTLIHYSINQVLNKKLVKSAIIGIKDSHQLKQNITPFLK